MKELIIEIITTTDGLSLIEKEWREIESHLTELPFVSFDWTQSWWHHLHSESVGVTDELRVFAFRDASGGLVGVAPMMLTKRFQFGTIGFRQLQFIGADVNITEVRCIAASVDDMARVYEALIREIRRLGLSCDWIKFTGIPDDTTLKNVSAEFGQICWSREVPNFILDLKPTWEEFKSGLPRNVKESLRKCYNAPKRDGLNFELKVLSDESEVEFGISEFLRLHTMRAQLADTIVHPNVFRDPSTQSFLRDVCARFCKMGRLRIFQLRHEGVVIATRIGFVCGQSMYLYYSGYDPTYAKYSVMTTTVAEAIQYAILNGFRRINLSVGRDVSKERWKPVEIPYWEVEVLSGRPLASIKYHCFKFASAGLKKGWIGKWMARNS